MSVIGMPYQLPSRSGTLRQGEILASVEEYVISASIASVDGSAPQISTSIRTHPFAVVLTQDCDLAQDFTARNSTDPKIQRLKIQNLLLCQLDLANNLKNDGSIPVGSDIWKRIIQNKDERYQYLRAVPSDLDGTGVGIEALLCDLKRIFTLPTDLLYFQLANGPTERRTVLVSPYMEQICVRHANFLSRIALPVNHNDVLTPEAPPMGGA